MLYNFMFSSKRATRYMQYLTDNYFVRNRSKSNIISFSVDLSQRANCYTHLLVLLIHSLSKCKCRRIIDCHVRAISILINSSSQCTSTKPWFIDLIASWSHGVIQCLHQMSHLVTYQLRVGISSQNYQQYIEQYLCPDLVLLLVTCQDLCGSDNDIAFQFHERHLQYG